MVIFHSHVSLPEGNHWPTKSNRWIQSQVSRGARHGFGEQRSDPWWMGFLFKRMSHRISWHKAFVCVCLIDLIDRKVWKSPGVESMAGMLQNISKKVCSRWDILGFEMPNIQNGSMLNFQRKNTLEESEIWISRLRKCVKSLQMDVANQDVTMMGNDDAKHDD